MVRIYLNTVSGDFSWLDSAAAEFAVNAALGGLSATSDGGNLYKLIDDTTVSHEPVVITGKRGNAVAFVKIAHTGFKSPLICH
jgi:hypothetical protein